MAIFKKSSEESVDGTRSSDEPMFLDLDGPADLTATERAGRWAVAVIAAALGGWLTWIIAASFVPRWWAQHIGQRVDGSLGAGAAWGFGYGFFATFLSLLILVQVRRKLFNWWGKLGVIVLALAVSAPSFMTLAVTIGSGKSSHAGRRIFDVNAPGFQWATAIGVGVGACAFFFVAFLMWRSRSNKIKLAEMRRYVDSNQTSAPVESSQSVPSAND